VSIARIAWKCRGFGVLDKLTFREFEPETPAATSHDQGPRGAPTSATS
jgi:hypothetical protein